MDNEAAAKHMVNHGGLFIHFIGFAWHFANKANRAKLELAFAKEFARYREYAKTSSDGN